MRLIAGGDWGHLLDGYSGITMGGVLAFAETCLAEWQ